MPSDGFEDIADIVQSLTAIVEEETGRLLAPGRHADMREMADAKARLVANLEAHKARLSRERPGWMEALEPEERTRLAILVRSLSDASILNARVLQRHIDLSSDMMAAVAAETGLAVMACWEAIVATAMGRSGRMPLSWATSWMTGSSG